MDIEMNARFLAAITIATSTWVASAHAQAPTAKDELPALVQAGMFSSVMACMVSAAEQVFKVDLTYEAHDRPITSPDVNYPHVSTRDGDHVPYTTFRGQNAESEIEVTVLSDLLRDGSKMRTMTVTVTSLATLNNPGYHIGLYDQYINVLQTFYDRPTHLPDVFTPQQPVALDSITAAYSHSINFATGLQTTESLSILANGIDTDENFWRSGKKSGSSPYRPASATIKELDATVRGCTVGN